MKKDIYLKNKKGAKRIGQILKNDKYHLELKIKNNDGLLSTNCKMIDTINIIGNYYLNLIENNYPLLSKKEKIALLDELMNINYSITDVLDKDLK